MQQGEIKDPHVFPFIVKGFQEPNTVTYESRRDRAEAQQSADRFRAEGKRAYIFQVIIVQEDKS